MKEPTPGTFQTILTKPGETLRPRLLGIPQTTIHPTTTLSIPMEVFTKDIIPDALIVSGGEELMIQSVKAGEEELKFGNTEVDSVFLSQSHGGLPLRSVRVPGGTPIRIVVRNAGPMRRIFNAVLKAGVING